MPRGRTSTTAITNSCEIPYKTLSIDLNSNCFICNCDGWLPIPVGKVQDFDSLEDVWNSPIAKVLQKNIDDKKFTWCAVEHCGIKRNSIRQQIFELVINIDESCNLQCPSCRRDKIMHINGLAVEQKTDAIIRIMSWLEKFEHPIRIRMSGNGDPLASVIMRPLIKNYQPLPKQHIELFTNGLLIKKQLADAAILPNIEQFLISVDAGSAEVYQKVRVGGSWDVLLENFKFLEDCGFSNRVILKFAVQKNNYQDLQNFIDCCLRYGFNANIHQLDDWGTWNNNRVDNPDEWTIINGIFSDHQVANSQHPEYKDCQQICQQIIDKKHKGIKFSPLLIQQLQLKQ